MDHFFKGEDTCVGSDYIEKIKALNSDINLVMMSADQLPKTLKLWLKHHADRVLYKDFENFELIVPYIEHSLIRFNATFGVGSMERPQLSTPEAVKKIGMIGSSKEIENVAKSVIQAARTDLSALIIGETGTGKELVAKALHDLSIRKAKPFVVVNCAQFKNNENLIQTELFGSEKGAFTGAGQRMGLLESAQGGTVFFDEVHHLSDASQAILLRTIETKSFRRVGSNKELKVNARFTFAGKPELLEMIEQDKFLLDLAFRMKQLSITIPALKDRSGDVETLVWHFLRIHTGNNKQLHKDAMEILQSYSWPGNVRELQSLIHVLCGIVRSPVITKADVLEHSNISDNFDGEQDICKKMSLVELRKQHQDSERELILRTFKNQSFSIAGTARELGVARPTFIELCERLGIREVVNKKAKKDLGQLGSKARHFYDGLLDSLSEKNNESARSII
jgi:DNA-binding NtrC family response regulator